MKRTSLYLSEHLLENISSNLSKIASGNQFFKREVIGKSLYDTFVGTNEEYKKYASNKYGLRAAGGSTSVVAALYRDENNKFHLSVSNAGDSRGVLVSDNEKKVYEMSVDHKPDSPDEKKRIESTGGFVTQRNFDVPRVNGVLATSRSFGDFSLSPQVIADPDIIDVELGMISSNSRFDIDSKWNSDGLTLVLASDGLWDVFSSQQISDAVNELRNGGYKAVTISHALCKAAFENHSSDNITVLVVFLDEYIESLVKAKSSL